MSTSEMSPITNNFSYYQSSRYNTVEKYSGDNGEVFGGSRRPLSFNAHPEDTYIQATSLIQKRLDLLAYDAYGDPTLWWVILEANDILSPFDGIKLDSQAYIWSSKYGPFTFDSTNNTLMVYVDSFEPQTITIEEDTNKSVEELVGELSSKISGVEVYTSDNRIVIRSLSYGASSLIHIHWDSTAYKLLGFDAFPHTGNDTTVLRVPALTSVFNTLGN